MRGLIRDRKATWKHDFGAPIMSVNGARRHSLDYQQSRSEYLACMILFDYPPVQLLQDYIDTGRLGVHCRLAWAGWNCTQPSTTGSHLTSKRWIGQFSRLMTIVIGAAKLIVFCWRYLCIKSNPSGTVLSWEIRAAAAVAACLPSCPSRPLQCPALMLRFL